jgi:fructokinase
LHVDRGQMIYGGIEAGGTKWVCAIGTAPDDIGELVTIPTTTPAETIARAAAFFASYGSLATIGVGSFGPLDLRPGSPSWGRITTTPKPGWSDTDVAGMLARALGVPIALDTDVNAAALAEHRFGAAIGLDTFCYITVGTGIGGGAVANGALVHGLVHPELGHMRIPHDRVRDPFDGVCPFHRDCLEGLASGEAIRQRGGGGADDPLVGHALELEAEYLALGLVNVTWVLSPERIVIGGGVMNAPGLLPRIRERVRELAGGYLAVPELGDDVDRYIVAPELGDRAGIIGALALAVGARTGAVR